MLTDDLIAAALILDRPYKLADANSLYVLISPTGSKAFRWKYRYRRREKLLALGCHPEVSIDDARRRVAVARERVKAGYDPAGKLTHDNRLPIEELAGLAELPPPLNGSRVYFAQISSGHIKIGVTINVDHRLRAFQHCHAEPVILLGSLPGGHAHEDLLHRVFARDRDHGEWFSPSRELLEFVYSLEAAPCR